MNPHTELLEKAHRLLSVLERKVVPTWLTEQGEKLTRRLAGHVDGYERADLLVERLQSLED